MRPDVFTCQTLGGLAIESRWMRKSNRAIRDPVSRDVCETLRGHRPIVFSLRYKRGKNISITRLFLERSLCDSQRCAAALNDRTDRSVTVFGARSPRSPRSPRSHNRTKSASLSGNRYRDAAIRGNRKRSYFALDPSTRIRRGFDADSTRIRRGSDGPSVTRAVRNGAASRQSYRDGLVFESTRLAFPSSRIDHHDVARLPIPASRRDSRERARLYRARRPVEDLILFTPRD